MFGADVVLQFHRQAGVIAFGLVLAHPAVLILSDPDYLEYFDPRVNLLRALALSAVIPAAALLLVTSLWRERVGLNYEWWRITHGALSLVVVFIGMVHGIQVGHYLDGWWRQGLWIGALCGAMYLVIHSRMVRPWRLKRSPYRVVDVITEASDVTTLRLRAERPPRLRYRSGQFVWITLGDSPHSMQQHPFSVSSGEDDPALELTAKELGDFTGTWPDVETGTTAFLEGPFGGFTLDRCAKGAVMIVGGIGVTPAMSILRTVRDRGDDRPMVLLYATQSCDDVTFGEELQRMAHELGSFELIQVPEEPPDGWDGPSGFIDEELLESVLTGDRRSHEFFICGPEPMMDVAERGLRALGVPWRRIYTERFEIV